jgi:hypothetical protein
MFTFIRSTLHPEKNYCVTRSSRRPSGRMYYNITDSSIARIERIATKKETRRDRVEERRGDTLRVGQEITTFYYMV